MSNCASEADEDEVALWEKENHVIYTYTTGPNINLKVTVPEEYGHLLGQYTEDAPYVSNWNTASEASKDIGKSVYLDAASKVTYYDASYVKVTLPDGKTVDKGDYVRYNTELTLAPASDEENRGVFAGASDAVTACWLRSTPWKART